VSIDLRTRTDGPAREPDPDALLDLELPVALEAQADRLAATRAPRRPLVLTVEDRVRTLAWRDGLPRLEAGDTAVDGRAVRLRLTPQQLDDLATDLITPIGLFTSGALDLAEGDVTHVLDWWLVLRTALDGLDPFDPAAIDLPDDLDRSFALDDDPAELRAFLEQAGFLHLRGVYDEGEMARISADMDAAAGHYTRGDGHSWWVDLLDGSERLVRMQDFQDRSPATTELLEDPRHLAIAAIPGCGHTQAWSGRNTIEALFKPIGVATGISDVPWHKDCSLGRHSYECCRLTVGVSVTGAGPTTGQLRVVPGSHRAHVWPSLLDVSTLGLPDIGLATETGDVTVHLSCTLHMAQPPTTAERRVLYTGFALPPADPEAARAAHRRLIHVARESAPLTTSQQSAR
jgi:ectoine hydroxylase-related dioxygenase (phytanoyl-CoA dioxygenase family)